MKQRPDKPKKCDFASMADFMIASAAWAEIYNQWPWADRPDEDDGFVFDIVDNQQERQGS